MILWSERAAEPAPPRPGESETEFQKRGRFVRVAAGLLSLLLLPLGWIVQYSYLTIIRVEIRLLLIYTDDPAIAAEGRRRIDQLRLPH